MSNTQRQASRRWARFGLVTVVGLLAVGGTTAALMGAGGAESELGQSAGRGNLTDLVEAATTSFDVIAVATGELEAASQIELRSRVEKTTTVAELVREGTFVSAGTVVVRLNAEQIEQEIDNAKPALESARADAAVAENAYAIQVNENDSALRQAQLKLTLAMLDLRQWEEGDIKAKRQELSLALDRATREVERLKDRYERAQTLEAQGFLARDQLRQDELAYLEAQASLKTAGLNMEIYESFQYPRDREVKVSDVREAEAEVERVTRKNASELATREADRVNKKQQLALLEAKLAKLIDQRDATVMRAPRDGLVVYDSSLNRERGGPGSEQALDVGRDVRYNQRLIVLPDTSEMVASVRVHESVAGRVREGQRAGVKIDALGGRTIAATVQSIGVIAESGGWRDPNLREYTVKLKLQETAGLELKPSMRALGEIVLDRVSDALAVPIQSVFSDGPVRYVVAKGVSGRLERRPVRVGRRSEQMAEILAGITEGDLVLMRAPGASEVSSRPWTDQELASVGLQRGPGDRIAPIGAPGNGPGGGERPQRPAARRSEASPPVAQRAPEGRPAGAGAAAPQVSEAPARGPLDETPKPAVRPTTVN
ncbi:MAG: hypothetical protein C0475_05765 [Planctomyces sp.]|nr:hypothetical protein [Planctomyces sp.]MBA4119954.1 hypothetical protein [Isosphaera sp.]